MVSVRPVYSVSFVFCSLALSCLLCGAARTRTIRSTPLLGKPIPFLVDRGSGDLQHYYSSLELLSKLRGGEVDDASSSSEEEDSEDFVEENEDITSSGVLNDESDKEEEEIIPSKVAAKKLQKSSSGLATSTLKAETKRKVQQVKAKAEVVNTELNKSRPSKKSSSFIPYIVRAALNPFTVWRMTCAYWQSLFQLDYLKQNEDSSQDLRSALELKARQAPSKKKPGKKMKRAKTLADLPQLNT